MSYELKFTRLVQVQRSWTYFMSSAMQKVPPAPAAVEESLPEPTPGIATATEPKTGKPYSAFSKGQKRRITAILSLATITSPLTATIYFPLLPLLQAHYNVSAQAINLTITLYIVFQAISPIIFAPLSDSFGRRPIFLSTFTVYFLASLGLALNTSSYAGLLVLRAVQSIGASAAVAVMYGAMADVCVTGERGKYLGPIMAASNLGACVGPVIGGAVAQGSGGIVWPFYCLVIFGVVLVLSIGFGLPETSRSVVGNGEVTPTKWWSKTWMRLLRRPWWKRSRAQDFAVTDAPQPLSKAQDEELSQGSAKTKVKVTNPMTALRIIFYRDSVLVLWLAGSWYTVYYCIQTSISPIFRDIYGWNELEIGLSYLVGGVGVVLGGWSTGKLMDWSYKKTAKENGRSVDKVKGDDLRDFPIEYARSRTSIYFIFVGTATVLGYGWAVQSHAHPSVPLILQFLLGIICTNMLQTFSALLVDVFPEKPSTAATSGAVTRCALSAIGVAILQPMIDKIGRAWYFTFLATVTGGLGIISLFLLQKLGMGWRQKRS